MPDQKIADRFKLLDNERSGLMDKKRECAEYVQPKLLPPTGWDETTELDTPLSSVPATGSKSLAAKIANAVLPTNGSAIGTPEVTIPADAQPLERELIVNSVLAFDNGIMSMLQSSNFRSELHDVTLDLVVIGDSLLELLENGRYRKHRLDNYVVVRREDGKVHELILRVWVDPETLPSAERELTAPTGDLKWASGRKLEPKYTRCLYHEADDTYKVTVEFRGHLVSKESEEYTILPYFPLKTGSSGAVNYGISIIEDLLGDIRSLMALELSLLEGSAANAEFRTLVNPAGVTDLGRLSDSRNGDFMHGRMEDVGILQLGSPAHVEITLRSIQELSSRILKTLLYELAYVGQNRERVTATEINATIQSIEGGLSSVLSAITQELHIPLVKRLAFLMQTQPGLSPAVKTIAKGVVDNVAPIKLRSGIEALHREIQAMRLLQGISTLTQLPPNALSDIDWRAIVFDLMTGLGFEGSRYLVSLEAKQAAEQNAAAMRVAENTGNEVGKQLAQGAGAASMGQPQSGV